MIPCVPSQDLIRLRKPDDSRRLWVGNRQDSSDGRSFEKAQRKPSSSTVPSLANCTRTNACELCRGAVGPAKLRRRLNDRPLVPLRSTSSARLFDGITPWDGNIPETDNPPWRSSVGRATWLSRSRCFLARMIGRQGLTHVRLGQAELARNARRRDASLECSANGVQLTTSQRGLS
jgi:hypothetical protein